MEEYTTMVKLTCKFHTIQNVSLTVLKHYLLEFNWYRAITQCTHPVNVTLVVQFQLTLCDSDVMTCVTVTS